MLAVECHYVYIFEFIEFILRVNYDRIIIVMFPPQLLVHILRYVLEASDLVRCSRVDTVWRGEYGCYLQERFNREVADGPFRRCRCCQNFLTGSVNVIGLDGVVVAEIRTICYRPCVCSPWRDLAIFVGYPVRFPRQYTAGDVQDMVAIATSRDLDDACAVCHNYLELAGVCDSCDGDVCCATRIVTISPCRCMRHMFEALGLL